MSRSAGQKFRNLVTNEPPVQLVGTINAYCGLLAKRIGVKAIYLSGAGVANASFGLPDLGMTSRNEVLEDAKRIVDVVDLPLIVDIDTGWGDGLNVSRTTKLFSSIGVAGVHIEDQVASKRCGHRPGKAIVSTEEMVNRVKAAVDGRIDDSFVLVVRSDAIAQHGLEEAIDRLQQCVAAGADMVFPEAVTDIKDYARVAAAVKVPVLANMTEFGRTPLYTKDELAAHDVSIVLYPLSAFRAMSKAAMTTYEAIVSEGTQKGVLHLMQTREELYTCLDYHSFEKKVDDYLKEDL